MTQRLMPPADGNHPTITINTRTYTCALGSTIDVPDGDALVMIANGWVTATLGGAGTTAQRPAPKKGAHFHDTTVGKNLVCDGLVWRDPTSGAAV